MFGTPQLSLYELRELAEKFAGTEVACTVYATTSSAVAHSAREFGYLDVLRDAGVRVLTGVCFYLMTARDLARRNDFRTLVTDSAKLANIVAGYGYNPVFRPTEDCVAAAVSGRLVSA